MRVLRQLGLCCLMAGCLLAQRHGGVGGGSFRGGTVGGGFRGGGVVSGGFRGSFGGIRTGFSGFRGNFDRSRGFYGGYVGLGYGLGYGFSPYGFGADWNYYEPPPYINLGSSYSYQPYEYNPSPNVTVIYPPAQQPAPVYYTPPVQPRMQNYDQYGQPQQQHAAVAEPPASASPIYLIATKDQLIRAAASYWVDGKALHYVTLQHEEKQVPLDTVDRAFSQQLNRERRVQFTLPQ